MKSNLPRRNAFTVLELMTVIAVIALLLTILIPSLSKVRNLARQSACKNNVREIARATVGYANDSRYHRGTILKQFPTNGPTTSNWNVITTGSNNIPAGNIGCIALLWKKEFLTPKVLLCPSAKAKRNFTEPTKGGANSNDYLFTDTSISYSFLSMVNDPNNVADKTTLLDTTSTLGIVADQNPAGTAKDFSIAANTNSLNHGGEGQNMARLDLSAQWLTSPVVPNAPLANDNIYRAASGDSADGIRASEKDIFLIP